MGGLSCLTQAQWLSGRSPHSSPEEPALPWVSVKSFPELRSVALPHWPGGLAALWFEVGVLTARSLSICPSYSIFTMPASVHF